MIFAEWSLIQPDSPESFDQDYIVSHVCKKSTRASTLIFSADPPPFWATEFWPRCCRGVHRFACQETTETMEKYFSMARHVLNTISELGYTQPMEILLPGSRHPLIESGAALVDSRASKAVESATKRLSDSAESMYPKRPAPTRPGGTRFDTAAIAWVFFGVSYAAAATLFDPPGLYIAAWINVLIIGSLLLLLGFRRQYGAAGVVLHSVFVSEFARTLTGMVLLPWQGPRAVFSVFSSGWLVFGVVTSYFILFTL